MKPVQAPFPYFGGKSSIAHIVWSALGCVKHYIEPFFGSGAVLLNRPKYDSQTMIETVNDKDDFLCNVWRALQHNPDEVAKWCDWPVNHADLSARKMKLIASEKMLLDNLIKNDDWYDAKLAGYWIWAAGCWIGGGLTRLNAIPGVSHGGTGVHKISKRPHLSDAGNGIHKISARTDIAGDCVQEPYNVNLYSWFRELSERLRYVRVVCGEWTRVCGGNWQDNKGTVGMFFDPPYAVDHRDNNIYHHDSTTVGKNVEAWCLARGDKKSYRIVVAGYEGEYKTLEAAGWSKIEWKAQGGYSNLGGATGKQGKINRHMERLWFSPHCLNTKNDLALL